MVTPLCRMSVAEIIATYAAKPVTISEPVLLIIVNKLFERNISPGETIRNHAVKLGFGRAPQ